MHSGRRDRPLPVRRSGGTGAPDASEEHVVPSERVRASASRRTPRSHEHVPTSTDAHEHGAHEEPAVARRSRHGTARLGGLRRGRGVQRRVAARPGPQPDLLLRRVGLRQAGGDQRRTGRTCCSRTTAIRRWCPTASTGCCSTPWDYTTTGPTMLDPRAGERAVRLAPLRAPAPQGPPCRGGRGRRRAHAARAPPGRTSSGRSRSGSWAASPAGSGPWLCSTGAPTGPTPVRCAVPRAECRVLGRRAALCRRYRRRAAVATRGLAAAVGPRRAPGPVRRLVRDDREIPDHRGRARSPWPAPWGAPRRRPSAHWSATGQSVGAVAGRLLGVLAVLAFVRSPGRAARLAMAVCGCSPSGC